MSKKALITGITGQDGSYLAEQLLEKGYEVHGLVRRSSSFNTERIDGLYRDPHETGVKLFLHHADLSESSRLVRLVYELQPDEVYHLGAQSHVRVSFDVPEYTGDVTGMGTLRLLESIRDAGVTPRFYQASSSEMYGATPPPQNEDTPFHPRSPYAVAKVMGYWITVNYRESYGLFACNGILFNHECVSSSTPLIVRENGVMAVKTPADLVPLRRKGTTVQTFEPERLVEVWDGDDFTPIRAITATKRRPKDPDHELLSIESRGGLVDVTAHHHMLDADRELVRARDLEDGDRVALSEWFPEPPYWSKVTSQLAELLGLLAADGYVGVGVGGRNVRFTNTNLALRRRVAELWSQTFLGVSCESDGISGFTGGHIDHLNLTGVPGAGEFLRDQLYTRTRLKQVPPLILNADSETQDAFLRGYYAGDGLKAGKGLSIKTNSPVLAQGLCWMYHLRDQPSSVYVEHRAGKAYYQLNLRSAVTVEAGGGKGSHLIRDPHEIRCIKPSDVPDDEWVFDLETESGVFAAGVGRVIVHNSPRRGETFVTRKITRALARIQAGLQDKLFLGNLDAQRDWGFAPDYTDAMWRMLQADEPEDYVIATGEMHSVREFLDVAGSHLGLNWQDVVDIDPRYYRPAEVDALCGDASKAKEKLGWTPTVTFEALVKIMVDADVKSLEDQLAGRGVRLS